MVASPRVVDEQCRPGTPALTKAHDASGWLGIRAQFLATQAGTAKSTRSLIQAVVNFPDAATATRFVETSTTTWQHCANRSVNLKMVQDSSSAPNEYWTTGAVPEADGGSR